MIRAAILPISVVVFAMMRVTSLRSSLLASTGCNKFTTAAYVRSLDPSWSAKPGTIQQYSLYNSANDVLFNNEDQHWQRKDRRFNSWLRAVPEFVARYFGNSALQNFRMQCIQAKYCTGRRCSRTSTRSLPRARSLREPQPKANSELGAAHIRIYELNLVEGGGIEQVLKLNRCTGQ